MATPRKGSRAMRFQNLYPRLLVVLKPLLDMPELHNEVQEYIAARMTFHGKHTNGLLDMHQVFGPDNCAMIRKFEIRAEWRFKTRDQGQWPQCLDFFSQALPNLTTLVMYTNWPQGIGPFPEDESGDPAGSTTRFDQDFRAVARFLSWLIIQHDSFKDGALLIVPANSGSRFGHVSLYAEDCQHLILKSTKDRQHKYESVTEAFIGPLPEDETEEDRWCHTEHDEVLHTRLIRRVKWTEYHNGGFKMQNFINQPPQGEAKSSITTSELATDDDKYFVILDERGYRPKEMFDKRVWRGRWNVDSLIEGGRFDRTRAVERKMLQSKATARGGTSLMTNHSRGRDRSGRIRGQDWRGRYGGRTGGGFSRGRNPLSSTHSSRLEGASTENLTHVVDNLSVNDTNFPGLPTTHAVWGQSAFARGLSRGQGISVTQPVANNGSNNSNIDTVQGGERAEWARNAFRCSHAFRGRGRGMSGGRGSW